MVAYLSPIDQAPYLLIRSLQGEAAWFSSYGVHELCIGREGSALQLKRWSRSEQCSKLWAALYFITWEGKLPVVDIFHDIWESVQLIGLISCRDGTLLLHLCRAQGSQQANCPNCTNRVPITKGEAALPSVRIIKVQEA